MKNNNTSSKNIIIKYGIVLGIISIIYNLILHINTNFINNITLIEGLGDLAILTCIITYGIYTYKVTNNGFLELGKAIKIGVTIAIIGALTLIIYIILLMKVIAPEMKNQIVDTQYKRMIISNPNISQAEIEKNIVSIKTINSFYIKSIMALVSNLLFGFLISLIGGAIMSKKKYNTTINNEKQ
ncbi:DUF4199 domain-containing protein [Aquimarina algiphila]|uniref:DUF4199 domain-containing protein n=1 Tax=Aquimarina algiphila TaxID=2047982 RepID=UPI00232FEC6C|nr:DUF4199 domain-containing protein [Aquimarina algiphila]